ncbi:c-type cytochrome [Polyangium jinanense]|uniref:C-type cytochrome n=1 Tax=Polyangium jinanense TaxID=2829994 RepID=A0A9X4ASQ6_9BACT|nr:c-type cytochrome [Polyangium jinanense]MDC3958227.1 c-type cytochrome [Polyangium jinanense]MDC3983438.1 c-type cytochrome [Polyangium jinanense]
MPTLLRVGSLGSRFALACIALGGALGLGSGCTCSGSDQAAVDAGAALPSASVASAPSATTPPPAANVASIGPRQGAVLARGVGEDALYVADEDHNVLRRVALPLSPAGTGTALPMPGPPAQVVTLPGRVLVTIRDPGLLVEFRAEPGGSLAETSRVKLPADAWGLAVTADQSLAIVTSAWTHKISAVDLRSHEVRWTVDVAREPRGIALRKDGQSAYISHLTGGPLTRIDELGSSTPTVRRVDLPPSPLRTPVGKTLNASLGYALAFSPDESLLFAPRHALGALGEIAWFGAATVDVLVTGSDKPLAPLHREHTTLIRAVGEGPAPELQIPGTSLAPLTQPRAIVYRSRTDTLLVAGEGDDRLVELDALAVDPTLSVVATYEVGSERDPALGIANRGGAPAGIVLSEDEATAFVFCGATYDLVAIPLAPHPSRGALHSDKPPAPTLVRLAEDPLGGDAALGRRLFYNATDRLMSGGLGCAGCHPEGRDDGHVWHEAKFNTEDGTNVNFVGSAENVPETDRVRGIPRRTPMLAGRVKSPGPYGWVGESPDLMARLRAGFGLHRWGGVPKHEPQNLDARAMRIAAFVRAGLRPPPREQRALDAVEQRGKEVFMKDAVQCARCHVPETEYTDRQVYPLPRLTRRSNFDELKTGELRVPSLLYLEGRAPYLHDGSAATLDELIAKNNDRMGKTNQLSREERDALAAFLRTL